MGRNKTNMNKQEELPTTRRRVARYAFFALCIGVGALLVACGGGGSSDSSAPPTSSTPSTPTNPTTPTNPNVINGITVPPDPGAAGIATVAGIDTDANGIRDDIDRFIATKYGANAVSVKAARTSARALQRLSVTDPSSKSAAVVVLQDNGDAGVCAGRDFRSAGLGASQELNELFARTLNTQARLAQYKAISASAGLFTRSVSSAVCQ